MILVTGATGLVGSHLLLQLLSQNINAKVRAIFREEVGKENVRMLFKVSECNLFEKIQWQKADITDIPSLENAFANVDFVYHCAGFVSFDKDDEPQLRKTNIEGTANIVNLCLAKNVKKLCHISSIAALGNPKLSEKISERSEWNPESYHSDYAISKFGGEMEVWRGQNEGLSTVILNPGVILGYHSHFESSTIIFKNAANGFKYYTNGIISVVSAEDVAKIAVMALDSQVENARFSVVSENVPVKGLLDILAKIYKVDAPTKLAQPWLTALTARILSVKKWFFDGSQLLTHDIHRSLHSVSEVDSNLVQKTFGFEFQSLEITLQKTAEKYSAIL